MFIKYFYVMFLGSLMYVNGSVEYHQTCNYKNLCDAVQNTQCIKGICDCSKYYDTWYQNTKCVRMGVINENCNANAPVYTICKAPLSCIGGYCLCEHGKWNGRNCA